MTARADGRLREGSTRWPGATRPRSRRSQSASLHRAPRSERDLGAPRHYHTNTAAPNIQCRADMISHRMEHNQTLPGRSKPRTIVARALFGGLTVCICRMLTVSGGLDRARRHFLLRGALFELDRPTRQPVRWHPSDCAQAHALVTASARMTLREAAFRLAPTAVTARATDIVYCTFVSINRDSARAQPTMAGRTRSSTEPSRNECEAKGSTTARSFAAPWMAPATAAMPSDTCASS